MFALFQLVAWAVAFGGMTHLTNVFAQNSTCVSNFTVQEGNTCQIIAAQFNITIADLEAANPVINSGCTNLAIGQVLCITAPAACPSGVFFVVQNGDVCIDIADSFNITVEALEASNPEVDLNCDNLFVGESLCIPAASS